MLWVACYDFFLSFAGKTWKFSFNLIRLDFIFNFWDWLSQNPKFEKNLLGYLVQTPIHQTKNSIDLKKKKKKASMPSSYFKLIWGPWVGIVLLVSQESLVKYVYRIVLHLLQHELECLLKWADRQYWSLWQRCTKWGTNWCEMRRQFYNLTH